MKERPASLTAAEVRGILDGTLTSFERPISDHPPYKAGDRLWIKEAWMGRHPGDTVQYKADGHEHEPASLWRTARYMPRWASRLDLEVVGSQPEKDEAGVWEWVTTFRRVQA